MSACSSCPETQHYLPTGLVYVLRLVLFMLNGSTGSVEGDFMYASFLKVSCELVTKPEHSLNKSDREKAHLFITRFSFKSAQL